MWHVNDTKKTLITQEDIKCLNNRNNGGRHRFEQDVNSNQR